MKNETNKLNIVQSHDISEFLEGLGELKSVQRGNRKCKFCNAVVSTSSIFVVFPEKGEVKFVCNKKDCISKAMIFMRNKNG